MLRKFFSLLLNKQSSDKKRYYTDEELEDEYSMDTDEELEDGYSIDT